ncbi:MAG: type II secretion system F family protein [Deltaproteobacteria bacterium]|nr:type II secretion system F family protein [Deltaproteobacteria bacterium]
MPVFNYEAFDEKGNKTKGYIEADVKEDAVVSLKFKGLFAYLIEETGTAETLKRTSKAQSASISRHAVSGLGASGANISGGDASARHPQTSKVSVLINGLINGLFGTLNKKIETKPSKTEILIFFKQLYSMIKSGATLYTSISELKDEVKNDYFKRVLSEVSLDVKQGSSFSNAIGKYGKIFGNLVIYSIKAAEESGNIVPVLKKLIAHLEESISISRKIKNALIYPFIMSGVGLAILFYIIVYVVPIISKVFKSMHHSLPLPTRIVLFTSYFLSHYIILLLILAAAGFIYLKRYVSTKKGRLKFDGFVLKLPLLGKFIAMGEIYNFSANLSMLLSGGLTLPRALEISSFNFKNTVLKGYIERAKVNLEEGRGLYEPLKDAKYFPSMLLKLIKTGEKSGNLDEMIKSGADIIKDEMDFFVANFTALLEPAMIIIMGLVVGFIVISIILPIFEMSSMVHR